MWSSCALFDFTEQWDNLSQTGCKNFAYSRRQRWWYSWWSIFEPQTLWLWNHLKFTKFSCDQSLTFSKNQTETQINHWNSSDVEPNQHQLLLSARVTSQWTILVFFPSFVNEVTFFSRQIILPYAKMSAFIMIPIKPNVSVNCVHTLRTSYSLRLIFMHAFVWFPF